MNDGVPPSFKRGKANQMQANAEKKRKKTGKSFYFLSCLLSFRVYVGKTGGAKLKKRVGMVEPGARSIRSIGF